LKKLISIIKLNEFNLSAYTKDNGSLGDIICGYAETVSAVPRKEE